MPRAGLTTRGVVAAAAGITDREGLSALTVTRVAEAVDVKPPSLYNHVDGLQALVRLVALDGIDRLAEVCRTAVMGRSGSDGLKALARAYQAFALKHPGVYPLTQIARPDDADFTAAARRVVEPVLALLAGFGLPDAELVHAARTVRSVLHGFVMLQTQSGFGLNVSVDESFEWMLDALERGLSGRGA